MKQEKPWKKWKRQKQANSLPKKFLVVSFWFCVGMLAILGAFPLVRFLGEDAHVTKIAKQYNCVCKMKCNMPVANCRCKEPGGATDVKNTIRLALKKGLNDEQIKSLLTKGEG